jgi:hypothetical protein
MAQSVFLRPTIPLKKYQISLFQNCLEAIKIILKDQEDINEFTRLDELLDVLIGQFRIVSDLQSIKALLILI